jgi:DNA-binding transcriptional ArsR family regulator
MELFRFDPERVKPATVWKGAEAMKRDVDLIRQILLDLEAGGAYANWFDVDIEEYSPEQMDYHLELLTEAGLITVRTSQREFSRWLPVRLTWKGHELLDAAREERQWQKAKEAVEKVGGVPFEVIATILLEMARQETNKVVFSDE